MSTEDKKAPYKNCLNCGEELHGMYCHKCGQYASEPIPKIKNFLAEYATTALVWDTKLVPTLWNLIRRPGFLTKQYMAGKFNSYEHPLKLNLFFIFLFITLFALLNNNNKINNTLDNFISKDFPTFILLAIEDNDDFYAKIKESEKDTIKLETSTKVISLYSDFIIPIDSIKANDNDAYHTYLCIVPTLFIDENILISDNTGSYTFADNEYDLSEYTYNIIFEQYDFNTLRIVWVSMIHIISNYFPLIFLLTTPLFAMAVNLLNIRKRKEKIWTYVFSLHYTAFVSLLLLTACIISLVAGYNTNMMRILLAIITIYLTIAIKNVYDNDSWIKSFFKGIATNILYIIIAATALFIIITLTFFLYEEQFNL